MPKVTVKPKKSKVRRQGWLNILAWRKEQARNPGLVLRKVSRRRFAWLQDQTRSKKMRAWIDANPPPRMGHQRRAR